MTSGDEFEKMIRMLSGTVHWNGPCLDYGMWLSSIPSDWVKSAKEVIQGVESDYLGRPTTPRLLRDIVETTVARLRDMRARGHFHAPLGSELDEMSRRDDDRLDAEFHAMRVTLKAWQPLDESTRDRVWAWVNAQLGDS